MNIYQIEEISSSVVLVPCTKKIPGSTPEQIKEIMNMFTPGSGESQLIRLMEVLNLRDQSRDQQVTQSIMFVDWICRKLML